jgi:hypothetical protein
MAVLVLAPPCGLGLRDELLSVSRELSLEQIDAVRTGYVDVYVDGSCFHNLSTFRVSRDKDTHFL